MQIYLLCFILLLIIELLYFRIADKFNIIDKPNERSSHTKITLLGGGVIFYVAMLLYFVYSHFTYPYFFVGLTLVGIISFLDDLKPQSPKFRLFIHFTAILLIFYQWNLFAMPWYIWLLALVVCVGIINAFNFMDGINGITGGYSVVVAVALWYINTHKVSFIDNDIIVFLFLSLLVFNFFNFRKKAKCFAGDVGAMSIAFILIFLIGRLMLETNDITYIILLLVYGIDTVMTILHRIKLKEPLTQAHRKHLFQIMANELKIPHLWVSTTYMFVQAIIIVGFLISKNHWIYLITATFVLAITYLLLIRKYFYLHQSNIKEPKKA